MRNFFLRTNSLLKKNKFEFLPIFLIGLLVGTIVFISIFGIKILNFSYVDRMMVKDGVEDLPQHYFGWEFFRRSSWSFPIGLTENLIYPDKNSVVYTDSIPIFALIFKIFSNLLPQRCQYFGLYGLLSYMLQGGFGALISYRYKKSKFFVLFAALVFTLSPIMLKRMFYHHALASHWLILAAFAIWIYKEHFTNTKKCTVVFSILCGITVLIHFYLVPIVFGIMLCYLLQDFLENKSFRKPIVVFICSAASIFLISYIIGLFENRNILSDPGGYGLLNYNLNGFFNSMDTSLFIKSLPLSFYQPCESYSYLGVGFIFFGLLAILNFISKMLKKENRLQIKKNIVLYFPWILMCLVFTILAIGPNVTFNDHLIFSINLQNSIFNLLSIFRASARFIWPVYYVIYIVVIRFIAKIKNLNCIVAISFLALLQIIDLSPIIKYKHDLVTKSIVYETPLKSSVWDDLGKTYKNIIFYKPTMNLYCNEFGYVFEDYALKYNLTLNAVYLARDITAYKDNEVTEHFEKLANGARYDENIYIFQNEDNIPKRNYGLNYYKIDNYIIGITGKINNEKALNLVK